MKKQHGIPQNVVFRRKSVQVYPGGRRVVLFYSDALGKYVTIPFDENGNVENISLSEALDGDGNPIDNNAGGIINKAKKFVRKVGRGIAKAADAVNDASNNSSGDSRSAIHPQDLSQSRASTNSESPHALVPRRNYDALIRSQNKRILGNSNYSGGGVHAQLSEAANSDHGRRVTIGEHSIDISPWMARRLLRTEAALNIENRKIFKAMLEESIDSLRKAINFSIQQGK